MGARDVPGTHPKKRDDPSLASALDDLERLVIARPELDRAGRTLSEILLGTFGIHDSNVPFAIDEAAWRAIDQAWKGGEPASRVVRFGFDGDVVRQRALAVCRAVHDQNPAAGRLERRLGTELGWLLRWAQGMVSNRRDSIETDLAESSPDTVFTRSALRLALLPTMAQWALAIAPVWTNRAMSHTLCPLCGHWPPALAESRGLERRRYARCGDCATAWPAPRLECLNCGQSDSRALENLFLEADADRYRVVRCETCGFTLKVVSTLSPLSAPGLLVMELAMIHLDNLVDNV